MEKEEDGEITALENCGCPVPSGCGFGGEKTRQEERKNKNVKMKDIY